MKEKTKDALMSRKQILGFRISDLAGIALMVIPLLISIVFNEIIPGKSLWFIPLRKESNVNIRPELTSMMCSAAFYISLVVRYNIFKKDTIIEIIVSAIRAILNMWVIAAYVQIALQTGTNGKGVTSNAAPTCLFVAVALSWLGMRSVAGYSWLIFIVAAWSNLLKVSSSMKMAGAAFVLFSSISLLLQVSSFSDITNFLNDFRGIAGKYGDRIKGDAHAAADDVKGKTQFVGEFIKENVSGNLGLKVPSSDYRTEPTNSIMVNLSALDVNNDGVVDEKDIQELAQKREGNE